MAFTQISDIINPEVLADQLSAKFPDQLVLGNSNLVKVDDTFPLGSPGTMFKVPSWKRIAAFSALTEGTAMTPGKITSYAEFTTVQRAGNSFEVLNTAELVSKADPVAEIAGQLARRAAEYIDAALVTSAGFTPNTFDQTVTAHQTNAAATMDQNAIIKATLTLGDNRGKLLAGGAIFMHSKVLGDLLMTGAIQNWYQSQEQIIKTGQLPMITGLPIYVSDLVPVGTVTYNTVVVPEYTTFIIGPEALALFYQRKVMVEFDRDILLQADVVASTVHFASHLWGYDEQSSAVVAEQNKSIHVVAVKTV